jgi:hypothetical protein
LKNKNKIKRRKHNGITKKKFFTKGKNYPSKEKEEKKKKVA